MKRGTPGHPKTIELCEALDLPRWGVVGLLESLWHFAATYAARGDLGRHSDASIARAIGWTDDPTRLMEALVRTRWLDRCICHRLRIHGWTEHADQMVKRREEVKKQGFLECYQATSWQLVADEVTTSQPMPLPKPVPLPAAATTPPPSVQMEGGVGGGGEQLGEPLSRAAGLAALERGALELARLEVGRLVARVASYPFGGGDTEALLLEASRTANGAAFSTPECCGSMSWLQVTRDKLRALEEANRERALRIGVRWGPVADIDRGPPACDFQGGTVQTSAIEGRVG